MQPSGGVHVVAEMCIFVILFVCLSICVALLLRISTGYVHVGCVLSEWVLVENESFSSQFYLYS